MFTFAKSPALRRVARIALTTAALAAFVMPARAEHPESRQWASPRRMLAEEHHFTFEFGYTLISQAATRTVDDSAHTLTSGSYDLSALWTPVHTEFGQGSIGFHLEGGHILDRDHNEDLSTNVGSILGIRDDLDNQEIALTELWWVWSINQTRIFTLGKIDPTAYFDANRIANDETTQFLATPLVNNLAAPFPDYGLGAVAEFHPADWFYINIGASDARANGGETGFNTVGEDWFYAGEFGFILDLDGHQGVYRFTVWGVDSDRGEDGTGFSLSFDQEVADHVVPFFRYGYGDVTDFRRSVSGGVGFEGLLGRADDLLAVGAVWADASDRALGAETLIEVFYRVQVAEWLQVTPDVQFVIDPAQGTGASVVFGLRVQAIF